MRNFSNNLQRMVYEILGYPEEDLSGREIRNLLIFVKAITNLFPSEERDVFFTVNPQNGDEQKSFQAWSRQFPFSLILDRGMEFLSSKSMPTIQRSRRTSSIRRAKIPDAENIIGAIIKVIMNSKTL